MNTPKKKQHKYVDPNSIEAVLNHGSHSAGSFSDQLKPSSEDFFDQLLGLKKYKPEPKHGDLSEGEEISLNQKQEQPSQAEPGIDYRREILHGERKVSREDSEIKAQVEQILNEIKALISASSELKVQYGRVVTEQAPQKVGKYELAFFDWLLITIRIARMKIEDSGNWLSMFASRKKQKSYWNQFKKQGTSFALNNERNVATQTG